MTIEELKKASDVLSQALKEDRKKKKIMKWIPTSEKLPDEAGDYLITYEGKDYIEYIITIAGYYPETDTWDFYYGLPSYIDEAYVLAWMPLPEPYVDTSNIDMDRDYGGY